MRKIHTLGPNTTDSVAAAAHIPGNVEYQLVLHDSFDEIISNLPQLQGDYFLVPTAYQSKQSDFGWRELSYQYWDQLELESVYHHPLKTMCLIENLQFEQNKAIVHPATTNLLNGYLNQKNLTIPIHYAGSKASAYKKFVRDGYRFSIISQDLLEADSKYQIIKTYHPDMVWCLYHIIK
ncbi:hypothetical protein LOOC260_120570 [Paucilactobacillus hokkaidonensis JCM 18461]|uniref:Prephenate dehydratase n=2 Tax=Paucilactobacillus hokkaidonensis TaxID=1193095 RepID=A0A0A1GZY3_9LACO|nr:hypothetical protein [Paucilactobacillus hokkaidonensis]KRO08194.1 hypothetical protein IV59_GL001476 [Paucilactobacillus hokkaidonensis]BAP86563.1 hypothetical protein LOOC260_120570 [Paucilactobacillus hokkaidonensis JCM 18461]